MPDLERPARITVRGSHAAYRRPERATVHVQVALEGPTAKAVHEGVARGAQALAEDLRSLHDPERGPVTWWASDQLQTWARRPWHDNGKQLPVVHHARVDLQAKFSDFEALSRWVTQSLGISGVTVQEIVWTLTEARQRELATATRAAAVHDARDRAQAYADALDLGPVIVRELADAGMLRPGAEPEAVYAAVASARAGAADGPDLDFNPQDVSVTTRVDAVFEVLTAP